MNTEQIRNLLYKRYIEPTKKNSKEFIGVEIEIPIVNLELQAVDFQKVHSITESFISHFSFDIIHKDDEGNIYSAEKSKNGDILSFDCSYNNLELSFGKEDNILAIDKRFKEYYTYLQSQFKTVNYTLTGMGINPFHKINKKQPIPNGRYRMLFHHLSSYRKYYDNPMYFHRYPNFGMFSSASQVQLDVNYDNLPITLNTLSLLEPIKAVLFSNSVLVGENEDILCYRDIFWENSTQGLNPHNIGMYKTTFQSPSDILSYISTTSIYCVERGEKYINFTPINIVDYFKSESIEGEYFDNGEYKKITFTPCEDDIKYLRTYKFEDLTYRGTIEYRSVCCQPISDSMTVSAFHLGLKNRMFELNRLLTNDNVIYGHGYNAAELRKLFIQKEIPHFVNEDELYALVTAVLDLSREGLTERGLGEEIYLAPLYERAKNRTNPAKAMLDKLADGVPLKDIVVEYSQI